MTKAAIKEARKMLPAAGRPDMAATAAKLRQLEQQGVLASAQHSFRLDESQLVAISTALLNPLTLLHGPPGTGKTTTIGGLLYFLRCAKQLASHMRLYACPLKICCRRSSCHCRATHMVYGAASVDSTAGDVLHSPHAVRLLQ
jgi:hypothetical protein